MAEQETLSLTPAAESDMRALMRWFPDAVSIRNWGGPSFRFPFVYESFVVDARWPGMSSWCLKDCNGMIGFGQYYDRFHRINLARIAVHPERRSQGIGRKLVTALMREAGQAMDLAEFSLFVYRDNHAAIRCYSALGFKPTDFPPGAPLQDVTYYMTCRKQYNALQNSNIDPGQGE